jgi:hypothetical protein
MRRPYPFPILCQHPPPRLTPRNQLLSKKSPRLWSTSFALLSLHLKSEGDLWTQGICDCWTWAMNFGEVSLGIPHPSQNTLESKPRTSLLSSTLFKRAPKRRKMRNKSFYLENSERKSSSSLKPKQKRKKRGKPAKVPWERRKSPWKILWKNAKKSLFSIHLTPTIR